MVWSGLLKHSRSRLVYIYTLAHMKDHVHTYHLLDTWTLTLGSLCLIHTKLGARGIFSFTGNVNEKYFFDPYSEAFQLLHFLSVDLTRPGCSLTRRSCFLQPQGGGRSATWFCFCWFSVTLTLLEAVISELPRNIKFEFQESQNGTTRRTTDPGFLVAGACLRRVVSTRRTSIQRVPDPAKFSRSFHFGELFRSFLSLCQCFHKC